MTDIETSRFEIYTVPDNPAHLTPIVTLLHAGLIRLAPEQRTGHHGGDGTAGGGGFSIVLFGD